MSALVPHDEIEGIVGAARDANRHIARAVSAERTVYILHSRACLDLNPDLRDCPWSLALDRGINPDQWTEDVPLYVRVRNGELVPGLAVSR